ncbi:MAG: hypothetical protein NG712_00545 [Omnitrophica bacterium]|nr:hypothetical protein [Candidatus Omnitrophota bacterium]
MNIELVFRQATKRYLDLPKARANLSRIKRQRALSGELLSRFSPKHYPCIFLDRRLRTKFFL